MKDFKIIELMELFDEGEVIPASQMQRPQQALDREMFLDANERLNKAGGGRIGYDEGSFKISNEKIKEIFPTYFKEDYTGKLDESKIKKILKLYSDEKGGRNYIGKKIGVDQSVVGRILKIAENNNIVERVKPGEFIKTSQRKYTPENPRKIYKTVREVEPRDYKKNPDIPKSAKFKAQVPAGEKGTSTKMVYGSTKEIVENKIKKAEELTETKKIEKKKIFQKPVKEIHKIAMADAEDISNISNLSKLLYGKSDVKSMTMAANDLVRYQQFLLGFEDVKGIKIPATKKLNDILSEFPSQDQWGKFASGTLRDAKLQIRDKLLKTKGPGLIKLRNNVLKLVDSDVYNLDEVMGVSATFEKAPGYTEFGQVIDKDINLKKANQIDSPFSKLFKKVLDGTATIEEVEAFNKKSLAFQKKNKIDTPVIKYTPGEKLNPKDFIDNFDKLSPEAQANVKDLAKKGVVLETKALPMGALESDVAKQLAAFSANPKCRVAFGKKDGGRINYATGPANLSECAKSGRNRLEKVIKGGVKLGTQEGALATQILKAGRSLGSAFTLSGLFGPAALAFTAAAEAGFVGYDMLTTGKTFKETIGDSLFNYALGDKTKIDPQKELFKRFSGLGYNDEQLGNFANVLNQTNQLNTILKQNLKVGNLKDQVKAFREQPKDQFVGPDDDLSQTDQAVRTEQALKDESLNLDNILKDYRKEPNIGTPDFQGTQFSLPSIEDTILEDMASGKFQETQQDLKAANIFADLQKARSVQDNFFGKFLQGDIGKQKLADKISGLEQDYLNLIQERGPQLTPFAGGGIADLSGGIDEGPQVESMNPDSQGLQGLIKRARNI